MKLGYEGVARSQEAGLPDLTLWTGFFFLKMELILKDFLFSLLSLHSPTHSVEVENHV